MRVKKAVSALRALILDGLRLNPNSTESYLRDCFEGVAVPRGKPSDSLLRLTLRNKCESDGACYSFRNSEVRVPKNTYFLILVRMREGG